MFYKAAGLLIALILHGCATAPPKPENADTASVKTHTLPPASGKTLSFKSAGCIIKADGTLQNGSGYASAGSYGTLVITSSTGSAAIDQYHVSCGALAAGGKSSCVIQHVDGYGTSKDYGGANCPDMKFKLINFKSF